MENLSLDDVFNQLKLAFERRKFEILNPLQDHVPSFFAFNKRYKEKLIFIVVDLELKERIVVRIYNARSANTKKIDDALQKSENFFSINSDKDLEKIISADLKAYPDIDDIANKFTRAYSFIVDR